MPRAGPRRVQRYSLEFKHKAVALEAERLHGLVSTTAEDLCAQLARCARYDNQKRLHSALGYQSPVDYERGAA